MEGHKVIDDYDSQKINAAFLNHGQLRGCKEGINYGIVRYHGDNFRLLIHFNKVTPQMMCDIGEFFATKIEPYLRRCKESYDKKTALKGEGSPNPVYRWQYDIQIYPLKFKRAEYILRDLLQMLRTKFNT